MKDKSILYMVAAMKVVWAVMLLFPSIAGDVMSVTCIYSASVLTGGHPFFTSMLYFIVSAMVLFAMRRNKLDIKGLWLFAPQLVLSLLSMSGAMWATIKGSYLDGTKIPAAHIFADQLIFIIIGFLVMRTIILPYLNLIRIK